MEADEAAADPTHPVPALAQGAAGAPLTPVDQRLVHPKRGDCMRCCLATLLDIKYEAVPDLAGIDADGGPWFYTMVGFLKTWGYDFVGTMSNMGRVLEVTDYDDLRQRSPGVNGLYMAGGQSPRFDCGHAIIIDGYGRMIHDPHPSRAGVLGVTHVEMIQKLR